MYNLLSVCVRLFSFALTPMRFSIGRIRCLCVRRKDAGMIKITAETTFAELKEIVPDVSEQRTPIGKALIRSEEPILIRVKEGSGTVTVYENGFFVYSEEDNHTARAVANCKVMRYPKAVGKDAEVKEDIFRDLPFPIVLAQFGMVNLEEQKAKKDGYHHGISLDDEQIRMEERLCVPDFAEELDLDGEGDIWEKRLALLPEAMEKLTEKQREIVQHRYFEEMTVDQAAAVMGITRRAARTHLERAEKNMKKSFENV